MSAAEFHAAMPEPHTILGLRLLPLSIGRYRLLKRFESPFVADDDRKLSLKEMVGELFFALIVCGLPCREFSELLNNNRLTRECKRFGKIANRLIRREKHFNAFDKIAAFKMYLAEASEVPWTILEVQNNSELSAAHWSESVEVVLRSKVNWTAEEIDEQPMGKALAHFFKFIESEGLVKLVKPQDYVEMQVQAQANGAALELMLKKN